MSTQQDNALMREVDVIGDRRRNPPIPGVYPVSRSEWRAGVKAGRYPKAIKQGHMTFWRRAEVMAMLAKIAGAE